MIRSIHWNDYSLLAHEEIESVKKCEYQFHIYSQKDALDMLIVHIFTHGWHLMSTRASLSSALPSCTFTTTGEMEIQNKTQWMTISKSNTKCFIQSNRKLVGRRWCVIDFTAKCHCLRKTHPFWNASNFSAMRIRVISISAFVTFTNKSKWWRRCANSCTTCKCFFASFEEHALTDVDVDGAGCQWFSSRLNLSKWSRWAPDIFQLRSLENWSKFNWLHFGVKRSTENNSFVLATGPRQRRRIVNSSFYSFWWFIVVAFS